MSFTGKALVELTYDQVVDAARQLSPEQQDLLVSELKAKKKKASKDKSAPKKLTKKQAARKAHILKSLDEGIAEVKAYMRGDKTATRPASDLLDELRSQNH